MRPCNDCGVQPGERHEDGCDIARCAATGLQHIQCEGERHEYKGHTYGEHEGTCQPDTWTGEWPGVAEAREFGWYTYFIPNGNPSWRRCDKDHPDAREDLTRLQLGECVWSPEKERWLLKTTTN